MSLEDFSSYAGSWGSFVIAGIAVVISIFSFVLTFRQHRLTYRWDRSRFAAETIEKFYTDKALILARNFIDWHDRELIIPKKYSPDGLNPFVFKHNIEKMSRAMSIESRARHPITGQYDLRPELMNYENMLYVEVFDRFVDYITQIKYFIDSGLISETDVIPLEYIVNRFGQLKDRDGRYVFRPYLELYGLNEVIEIIELCEKGRYSPRVI